MKKLLIVLLLGSLFWANAFDLDDMLGDFDDTPATSGNSGSANTASGDFELILIGEHSTILNAPVDPDNLNFDSTAKTPGFRNNSGITISYKNLKLVSLWNIDLMLNSTGDVEKIISASYDENALYWSPWKFKIGAGFQYYSWGKADGLNPTDNINPRDYSYGASSEKIPVLSLGVNFYPVNWFSMEAVYVPYYQRSIFPKDMAEELKSMNAFKRKSASTGLSNSELIEQITNMNGDDAGKKALAMINLSRIDSSLVRNVSYKYNDFDFKTPIAGGRLNFNTKAVDFSFSYLYDYDKFPTPVIKLAKEDISQLLILQDPMTYMPMGAGADFFSFPVYSIDSIKLEFRRVHRIGFDIKKVLNNGMGLWLEANYSMTDDYMNDNFRIRNDKFEWTAGTDFNWGPASAFYTNIQYSGAWNIDFDDKFYKDYRGGTPDKSKLSDKKYMEEFYYRAVTNSLSSTYAGLVQGLLINMKFPFMDDKITPEISAGYMLPLNYNYDYETKYGSAVIKPSIAFMPFDSFVITLGADLVYSWHKVGDEVSLDRKTDQLGNFIQDNRIFLEVNYKWAYSLRK
jgi:hypothetical protein